MRIPTRVKSLLLDSTDRAFSMLPRSPATPEQIRNAHVIAHRGAWDESNKENTMGAFEQAIAAGAWGVEFDVRFCSDGPPVVHHDFDSFRVFGKRLVIGETGFDECRSQLPLIPAFEDVVAKIGGRAHLMIELKGKAVEYDKSRWLTLKRLLSGLEPGRDYHLMAIDPDILLTNPHFPREILLPIAEFNFSKLSALALKENLGGATGPYALVGSKAVERHLAAGQKIGTGFVSSPSVLWREIKRGVEWLFTNHSSEVVRMMKNQIQK